jgi:hypothetical protein
VKAKPGAKAQAKAAEPKTPKFQVPFTRKNYIAFAVGLAVLLLGYVFLAQPPADGFLSRTLAPILLVLGYCVIFPYAIMARQKPKITAAAPK